MKSSALAVEGQLQSTKAPLCALIKLSRSTENFVNIRGMERKLYWRFDWFASGLTYNSPIEIDVQ